MHRIQSVWMRWQRVAFFNSGFGWESHDQLANWVLCRRFWFKKLLNEIGLLSPWRISSESFSVSSRHCLETFNRLVKGFKIKIGVKSVRETYRHEFYHQILEIHSAWLWVRKYLQLASLTTDGHWRLCYTPSFRLKFSARSCATLQTVNYSANWMKIRRALNKCF